MWTPGDIAAFERAPVGRAVRGRCFLVTCVDPHLCVSSIWGRPDADDARALTRLCEVAFHPSMAAPFATVIDVRHLEAAEPEAFAVFAGYVGGRGVPLGRVVRKQAILRPHGLLGAVAVGFCSVFTVGFPARVFTEMAPGLAYLERGDSAPLALSLDAALAAEMQAPGALDDLRRLLDRDAAKATLDGASRELATSARSLQRQLTAAGTSFRAELHAARVRRAQRLMLETDWSLSRIAIEVGYSSLQHLGATFRRVTGMAPSHWQRTRAPSAA